MDFHIEREIRLNTETKHTSLYKWAIDEFDAQGQRIVLDQIPWEWTLDFTATSCELSDSLEIRRPLNFKFKVTMQDGTVTEQESGGKETREKHQVIRIQLRSGTTRGHDDYRRQTTFSMFGTDRAIKSFQLNIYQLTDAAEEEQCTAWGCPSYTTEVDFRNETTEDCIVFSFSVKPEVFARYVDKINQGFVDEISFRVGKVDGFYSEWSPEISTDKVKVLTADREHKITMPPGNEFEPPRLGRVGDVALFINRKLEFKQASSPEPYESEPKIVADAGRERAVPYPQALPAVNGQMLQTLRSVKRAAWIVVGLVALILIGTLLRH